MKKLFIYLIVSLFVLAFVDAVKTPYPESTNPYNATRVFHLDSTSGNITYDALSRENGNTRYTEDGDWIGSQDYFGNALSLDNTVEYMNTRINPGDILNPFALSFWFKDIQYTNPGTYALFGGGEFDITSLITAYTQGPTGILNLTFLATDGANVRRQYVYEDVFADNSNWHNLFIVYNGGIQGNFSVYLDGVVQTMLYIENDTLGSAVLGDFFINGYNLSFTKIDATNPAGGKYDDVLYFEEIPSSSEIYTIANGNYTLSNTINITIPDLYLSPGFMTFNVTANSNVTFTVNDTRFSLYSIEGNLSYTNAVYINNTPFAYGQNISIKVTANYTPRICYQEFTNKSSDCVSNAGGVYSYYQDTRGYLLVNYTKPREMTPGNTAKWKTRHGNLATINYTIPELCYSNDILQFRFLSFRGSDPASAGYCWNTTGWQLLSSAGCSCSGAVLIGQNPPYNWRDGDWDTFNVWTEIGGVFWATDADSNSAFGSVYEEAMWWDLSVNYPIIAETQLQINGPPQIFPSYVVENNQLASYNGTIAYININFTDNIQVNTINLTLDNGFQIFNKTGILQPSYQLNLSNVNLSDAFGGQQNIPIVMNLTVSACDTLPYCSVRTYKIHYLNLSYIYGKTNLNEDDPFSFNISLFSSWYQSIPMLPGATTYEIYFNNLSRGWTDFTWKPDGVANSSLEVNNLIIFYNLTMPEIDSVTSKSITMNWTWQTGDDDHPKIYTWLDSFNVTIYPVVIDNCSIGSLRTLNVTTYNITTGQPLNSSIRFFFEYEYQGLKQNFSYQNTNTDSTLFCIYPNFTSQVISDLTIEYGIGGVYSFNYITSDMALTNSSMQNLALYLSDDTTLTKFTVTDTVGTELEDVYISILKWDVGTGTFIQQNKLKTDYNGEALGYINLYNTWYKFILTYNNEVVLDTNPAKVSSNQVNFMVNLLSDYYKDGVTSLNMYSTLTFQNSSLQFTNTYANKPDTVEQVCVVVKQQSLNGVLIVNQTCSTSASASLLVNLGTASPTGTFTAQSYAVTNDSTNIQLRLLSVDFDTEWQQFGLFGVFVSFLLIVAAVMIGLWNIAAAIIFMVLGFIVVNLIGLLHIQTMWIIGLIAMAIIAIARIHKGWG